MAQSPLLVRMDSGLSSDDGFDSDNFDDDNNSIDSKDIEPAESRQTFRRHPTDIQISDGYETVNFGIAVKSDEPYSPDPFAINYRKTTDWDAAAKAQWQREWWFVPNLIEKYESVEHAEFTRPFDQFRVLLQVETLSLVQQEPCMLTATGTRDLREIRVSVQPCTGRSDQVMQRDEYALGGGPRSHCEVCST